LEDLAGFKEGPKEWGCKRMIKAFEFTALWMPAFMLGFAYHEEHPDTGFRAVEIFLGLFALSVHF
jgi:hypothetical protein